MTVVLGLVLLIVGSAVAVDPKDSLSHSLEPETHSTEAVVAAPSAIDATISEAPNSLPLTVASESGVGAASTMVCTCTYTNGAKQTSCHGAAGCCACNVKPCKESCKLVDMPSQ
eukprot:c39736_g1_i1.p2 GENE.c39736_g1_i1~~c39736_g1_i1.p2  ORF type:complete len:124 (+),score=18.75 c39736_g1_i1:31-372(+)